jgi:hypothetical protein
VDASLPSHGDNSDMRGDRTAGRKWHAARLQLSIPAQHERFWRRWTATRSSSGKGARAWLSSCVHYIPLIPQKDSLIGRMGVLCFPSDLIVQQRSPLSGLAH